MPTGTTGNNTWEVKRYGDSVIYDGLAGVDTLSFERLPRSYFIITQNADGSVNVDSVSGASALYKLKLVNMEILSFANGSDRLDLRTYFAPADTTPPSFVSATTSADGTAVQLTYSETLATASPPLATSFQVSVGGTVVTPTGVNLSGTTLSLVLPSGTVVRSGESVQVAYTDPSSANDTFAIQDAAGNDAVSLPLRAVTNASTVLPADTVAPTPVSLQVNPGGDTLNWVWSEALQASALPIAQTLQVNWAGMSTTATAVQVSGNTLTVQLPDSAVIRPGEAVSVRYTDPSTGNDPFAIQDLAGNDASSVLATATNGSVAAPGITGGWIQRSGTGAAERLFGTGGNDSLQPGGGNDTVQGGDGTDRVVLGGTSANYRVAIQPTDGSLTLTDTRTVGGDGVDQLQGVEQLQFADRTVMVESRAHASFADLPASMYQFFILAFGAAPGVEYLQQCADAYRDGASVQLITNVFCSKSQFTSVYPTTLTNRELASQLVEKVVGTSAAVDSKTAAVGDIAGALDAGLSVGNMIFTVFSNLAAKPLQGNEWSGTARLFQNQIAVAQYYTETLNQSTTDRATLGYAIAAVGADSDVSTDAAKIALIGQGLMGY